MSGLPTGPTVAVVGAGAVGTTAAVDLAGRGASVHLFERGDVAAGSTPRAAGVCYDAFAEDVDAAVADRAIERFRHVSGGDDEGFAFTDCPYVWLAREGDDRRATAIREGVERMRANDRDVERLDPGELGDRFPAVRDDDVAVGALAHDAGYCDPGSYVEEMLDRLERAEGEIHTGVRVGVDTDPLAVTGTGVDVDPDAILVAAGAHSRRLLADAGVAIPVKPYRVQALTAGVDPTGDAPVAGYHGPMVYDATGGFYCRPHPDGLLAGDGTEERETDPDAFDHAATPGFPVDLADRVRDRLHLDPALDRAWAGLCTATPDRDPLVGAVAEGLYVVTGFQGHGFMRSPAIGESVAEAIVSGEAAPIDQFDPRRFDGDESFQIREGMLVEE